MSAAAFLRGAGNWTAYLNLGTPWLSAGWAEVTSPAAILAAAAAAGAGLYGLAAGTCRPRRWLWLRGPGFRGGADRVLGAARRPAAASGRPAVQRGAGAAAQPLQDRAGRRRRAGPRPAHAVSRLGARRAGRARRPGAQAARRRAAGRACPARARGAAAVRPGAAAGLVQPGARVLVPGGRLPGRQLARADALVVPADSHGLYLWGDPIDDPLEPLASSPWAERALVPYGGAGSQVFLDTAEQAVESDQPVPGLPVYLARAGIRYVVVRNDLDPGRSAIVSPQIVNQTLALSGFERVASFGPRSRPRPATCRRSRWRPVRAPATRRWRSSRRPAPPGGPRARYAALPVSQTVLVNGGPDSLLQLAGQGVVTSQPAVIAGTRCPAPARCGPSPTDNAGPTTLSGLTTQNVSFTYTATETNPPDDQFGGSGDPPRQLLPVRPPGTRRWPCCPARPGHRVVVRVLARQAPQYDPVNAFDGDPATAWAEGSDTPVGQWIQISFDHTLDLPATIGIRLLADSPARRPPPRSRSAPRRAGSAPTWPTPGPQALRVARAAPAGCASPSPAPGGRPGAGGGISDVLIPGIRVTRYLQPARTRRARRGLGRLLLPPAGAVAVHLRRPGRRPADGPDVHSRQPGDHAPAGFRARRARPGARRAAGQDQTAGPGRSAGQRGLDPGRAADPVPGEPGRHRAALRGSPPPTGSST